MSNDMIQKATAQPAAKADAKTSMQAYIKQMQGEIIMETYGVPPSRVIGEIKEIIKEAILEGEIPNDYEAAYALMERLAEERGLRKKQ